MDRQPEARVAATLTSEQVAKLRVGSHVRAATGEVCEVIAVSPGKREEQVYTLARWDSARSDWQYCAEPATLLRLLYSPAAAGPG